MKSVRFISLALVTTALLFASVGWSQSGNPPAGTKERGATSGRGYTAVKQTYVAAESDSKSIFAKHWQIAKEFTLAVAEAMPAEGYNFKPNPEELSFGQLMIHIAAQNSDSCADATGTKPLAGLSSSAWPPETDRQTAIKLSMPLVG